MHADVLLKSLGVSIPFLLAFLLVLTRILSIFVFIPVPMMRQAPEIPKLFMALTLTLALLPLWPQQIESNPSLTTFLFWIVREAGIGLTIGLVIGFVSESLGLAAQMISMQAGYSYATSIDPNSNADSGVLSILAQLMATLLFFAFGLDRYIISALAKSLETIPPGSHGNALPLSNPEGILKLSSGIFSTALRIALPITALLLIIDLTLALLSRMNQQLQLLTVAFPAKMILTLLLLAAMAPVIAQIYRSQAQQAYHVLRQITQ